MILPLLLATQLSAKPSTTPSPLQCLPPRAATTSASVARRVDSLASELALLEKILATKGIDFEKEKRRLALEDSVFDIPADPGLVLGSTMARHTLSVFTDPQCPYCQRLYPQLDAWVAAHPDLKVAVHLFPLSFHNRARPAARAYWAAARQGKFPAFFHALHAGDSKDLSDDAILKAAAAAGADLGRFRTDWDSEAADQAVERDYALGEAVGVQGTPSMYLDGRSTRDPEADLARTR